MNIRQVLSTIITKVYENERDFLVKVYPKVSDNFEIDGFYMASERCHITFLNHDGSRFTDTVKTQDVLDWLDELDN